MATFGTAPSNPQQASQLFTSTPLWAKDQPADRNQPTCWDGVSFMFSCTPPPDGSSNVSWWISEGKQQRLLFLWLSSSRQKHPLTCSTTRLKGCVEMMKISRGESESKVGIHYSRLKSTRLRCFSLSNHAGLERSTACSYIAPGCGKHKNPRTL